MKEWTLYNLRLGPNRYTMGHERVGAAELMAARYLQLISDLSRKPLTELRALDLGAGEGLYGLELAAQGASVLAVEGREEHVEKARYCAAELGIEDRYDIQMADVRDVSVDRYGTFDVILCAGILYHLEADDVFRLVQATYAMAERVVLFRTSVGLNGRASAVHNGEVYRGFLYPETTHAWAGINNHESFWPTRPSLLNLLCDVGFTSVVESVAPSVPGIDILEDLVVLAAIKGRPLDARLVPESTSSLYRAARIPERQHAQRHPSQRLLANVPLIRRLVVRRFWQTRMRRG